MFCENCSKKKTCKKICSELEAYLKREVETEGQIPKQNIRTFGNLKKMESYIYKNIMLYYVIYFKWLRYESEMSVTDYRR